MNRCVTQTRRVLVIYGTRPEAIKLAPVVAELRNTLGLLPRVAVTGQHRELLDQVNDLFDIVPDYDLDIFAHRQSLTQITSRSLDGLAHLIRRDQPDAVLVQGDTTTAFVGALAAFYHQIPVIHLEAGMRTGLRHNPFPEEINRRLIAQVASMHLAPSTLARENLLAEGIDPADILVVGTTVIDALHQAVTRQVPYDNPCLASMIESADGSVLVTSHRRESWGDPMRRVATAVATLATEYVGHLFIVPAHPNPAVREVLIPPLSALENVLVIDPLPYGQFCRVMAESDLLMSDSGGVQEEAPSLGKPLLLLRESTERPEGVQAGAVHLVGTDPTKIVSTARGLLDGSTPHCPFDISRNPYGDGQAAGRSVQAVKSMFGLGPRPIDFAPHTGEPT